MGLNLKAKITDFHYKKQNILFYLLFFIPSFFYFLAISFKNFLYCKRILKEKRVSAYVICVGNLTTGGVGKTPVVIKIANYIASKGKKVAILTRGYKAKLNNKTPNLIRTYDKILIDNPALCGDEASLISNCVSNTAVITCKNRLSGAEFAIKNLNADIILMDDGFSNRKIYKDINLLLIDKNKVFGREKCLPLGPLREPVSEIRRAHKIIFVDKNDRGTIPVEIAKKYKIPYSNCKMRPLCIYNIKSKQMLDENQQVAAFCAIGQPEQFFSILKTKVQKVCDEFVFDDHIEYNQAILNKLIKSANGKPLVTTQKDATKLKHLNGAENIFVLKLSCELNIREILNF